MQVTQPECVALFVGGHRLRGLCLLAWKSQICNFTALIHCCSLSEPCKATIRIILCTDFCTFKILFLSHESILSVYSLLGMLSFLLRSGLSQIWTLTKPSLLILAAQVLQVSWRGLLHNFLSRCNLIFFYHFSHSGSPRDG